MIKFPKSVAKKREKRRILFTFENYSYRTRLKTAIQMDTMYDTMLQLPLFQGMTEDDLTSILEKVKFHFAKFMPGEVIVQAGSPCKGLVFVMRGLTLATTVEASGRYCLTELCGERTVLEPQQLFGMTTAYVATHTAKTETHTISVTKPYVMKVLLRHPIFLLNYLNMATSRAQTMAARHWRQTGGNSAQRIAAFMLSLMERPAGPKSLQIKMDHLAQITGETRMNISRVLHEWQDAGWVELKRREIFIPDAAKLIIF